MDRRRGSGEPTKLVFRLECRVSVELGSEKTVHKGSCHLGIVNDVQNHITKVVGRGD